MEKYFGEDSVFALLGAFFIIFMAIRAWRKGAMEMLWGLFSWSGGLAAGIWSYRYGTGMLAEYANLDLSPGKSFLYSIILAVITFALVRLAAKTVFNRLFGPESTLGGWMYGGTGSILSALPSLGVLLVMGLLIRGTGTMYELNQIDEVSANRTEYTPETYPNEPIPTRWRNALEGLPKSGVVMDLFDPVSTEAKRNLASLLLASFNPYLKHQLRNFDSTRAAAAHPITIELVDNSPELTELIAGKQGDWKYLRLLREPKLKQALQDPTLRAALEEVDVAEEIEAILTGRPPTPRKSWLERILS